jgi:hypothetical protein
VPFAVAINSFAGSEQFDDATVRESLALLAGCPLIRMDGDPESCLAALIGAVEHTLRGTPRHSSGPVCPPRPDPPRNPFDARHCPLRMI